MSLIRTRSLFFLGFLGCLGLMAAALYLEHVVGLEPCPLCIVQRVCVIAFGLVCLVAAVHGAGSLGARRYAALAALFALLGAGTAGRQIWLQSVPADQLPSCLPSLDYMMQALPFQEIIRLMLHGTADCAEVSWTLLGLSIPEWSLLGFLGMLLLCVLVMLRRR